MKFLGLVVMQSYLFWLDDIIQKSPTKSQEIS